MPVGLWNLTRPIFGGCFCQHLIVSFPNSRRALSVLGGDKVALLVAQSLNQTSTRLELTESMDDH
jgi:hypothetical protein